jgi:hypothetical protein
MSPSFRVSVFVSCVVMLGSLGSLVPSVAHAGTVSGKLELPPAPERPPAKTRGFLDRVENPLAPPRRIALAPHLLVALEPAAGSEPPVAPPQVVWELVGESFGRPVIGAPVGAEVVIKNVSLTARSLSATEDPKLVPPDPINPTGSRSFRTSEVGLYTIGDPAAPHLKGTLVVVGTRHVASVDDTGRFVLEDVPEGKYTLRVFYADAWLDIATEVQVGAKGKTEVNPKVPALPPPGKK